MPERFDVRKERVLRRPRSVYPFEEMVDIGDYFDAPDDMGHVLNQEGKSARRHSILGSYRNYAARHNPDFKVSTTIFYKDGHPFVRCQRIPAGPKGEAQAAAYEVHKASLK